MKIKTSELTGLALDWAAGEAAEVKISKLGPGNKVGVWLVGGRGWYTTRKQYSPSTDWSQGGPIIEREGISMLYLYVTDDPFRWAATQKPSIRKVKPESLYGPTPLIAAMRCYVASKIGDEVEVPDDLA